MLPESLVFKNIPKDPKQIEEQIRKEKEELAKIQENIEMFLQFECEALSNAIDFVKKCRANRQKLKSLISQKFQALQTFTQFFTQQINDADEQIKQLEHDISLNQKKIRKEDKSIKLVAEILRLQYEDEELEIQTMENLQANCDQLRNLIDIFIETINEKELLKKRVKQFIRNYNKVNKSIRNPQPTTKCVKPISNKNLPEIEFKPESEELIFRVMTFEGQIIQFILFFDQDTQRLGLKNPCKQFKQMDLNAVRGLNFHKNITEFYKQLCVMVVEYVDDADILPVYQGK